MGEHYDFCGYATKNDLLCSDGRTIKKDAFKECDGTTVPLLWNHIHDDPEMVLGHALLENRKDGVYMYGKFNDGEKARACKNALKNNDVRGLSIHANRLKQYAGDVLHGVINEVSLVLKGANPGALIDFSLAHGDGSDEDEGWMYLIGDEYTELRHGDIEREVKEETHEEPEEENKQEEPSMDDNTMMHAEEEKEESKSSNKTETVEDVLNTLTDKQKTAVYALLAAAQENDNEDKDEEDKNVKHNAFESYENDSNTLTHADMEAIFRDAKKNGSLRDAVDAYMEENGVLEHADSDYGITRGTGNNTYFVRDPEMLFPDYRTISNTPEFIKRDTNWVTEFMSAVKHTPFARIKTLFADITIEDARALGYVKGRLKKEEFFNLIKRTTDPQTIYKKQKMDRDDVIDIVDFDVVAWIKGEMRDMLEEEIARACLIGDGRDASSNDKIFENHVRSVLNDADLFSVKVGYTANADPSKAARQFVREAIHARKDYKGTGNPIMFTSDTKLADLLTMEDEMGRFIYETEAQLITALRVRKVVTVPLFEGKTFTKDGITYNLEAITINPIDYVIGADKGGAVNIFDNFDIDFNQQKYLIETRISGALVKPQSAIIIGSAVAGNSGNEDPEEP